MKTKRFRIGTIVDRRIKAERERLSGILRYVSQHPDLRLEMFTPDNARQMLRADLDGAVGSFPSRIQTSLSAKIPVVGLDSSDAASDARIIIDNCAIAQSAFEFLHRRGNTNYAYIPSDRPLEAMRSRERGSAFCSAAKSLGFDCPAYRFPSRKRDVYWQTSAIPSLANWLLSLEKPCAILAYADEIALLAVNACHYAHLSIPDQIQVVGVDNDSDICENTQPSITSVWPDFYMAGLRATKALHKILLTKRPKRPWCEKYGVLRIVERASTADFRGGSRIVSLANAYLRQNFRTRINISEMASELNVSRRLLDMRYREIMGHTLHEEWNRLRLAEAKNLIASGHPVKAVFERCGFGTIVAFRKAFKLQFGVTPTKLGDLLPTAGTRVRAC